jgi:hypothetical protein
MRIGGCSQEALTAAPPSAAFASLQALGAAAGLRFIIGLPLEGGDIELARSIMGAARAHLGEANIVGFELGNEPGLWRRRSIGGGDDGSSDFAG